MSIHFRGSFRIGNAAYGAVYSEKNLPLSANKKFRVSFRTGKRHFRSNPRYVLYPAYCSYQQTDKENGYQGKYISFFLEPGGLGRRYCIYIIDRKIYTDRHSF